MPWGPRCFKCMFDMLSIPTAEESLSCFMIRAVSSAVASIIVVSRWNSFFRLYMRLSSLCLGRLLISA